MAPRLAQFQHPIPAFVEDAPDHIAIDMPQRMIPDEPDDGSDSSDSSSSSSSSSRSRESAVGSSFSGIISERDSPVPDELDIPARSAAACRPVATHLHLGLTPHLGLAPLLPNPIRAAVATPDLRAPQAGEPPAPIRDFSGYRNLAFQFFATMHPEYRPEGSALTPERASITHGGRSEHRGSAQADPDILRRDPNSVELLPPPVRRAVDSIMEHASAGAASLAQSVGGVLGQAANSAATSFMREFKGAPATPQQQARASQAATSRVNLSGILSSEQPAAVPSAPRPVTLAQSLGGAVGRAAGQALRSAGTDFMATLTGTASRDPSASAAASAAAPADATPQGFFSQIFTGLKNAGTKKFTELRFAGIALTLAQKVADMKEGPAKAQLNEMLAAIGRFQNGEITQAALEATLTRIMNGQDEAGQQIRDFLHIHINGFELPIRTEGVGSAEQTLHAIQAAHPLLPQTALTADEHQASLGVRQARLVANISTMAPLNLVNEWLCGGLLSKEKIAEILGKDRNATNYHTVVKKAFYAELNNLFILRRWAAKFTYWAFSGLSSTILSSFIQGILVKMQSSVKVETTQRQQEVHTAVITGINKGLTAYNLGVRTAKQALEGRPSDDVIISDSDTMLGNELARPPYNEGETKETLYDKAIDKAVDEILPPLGWTKSLKDGIRRLPGFAQAVLFPLTFIAWGVVAGTESTSDFIIRSVIRRVVKYTKILDTVIDLSVDQVSRNGYTHAINKLLLQQIKLIGEALDKEDSVASSTSMANKEELRKLAKELFRTLETQRREGQVDTDAATTLENFKRSVYHLTSDLSADAIALIIDQAKNIILDPTMIAMRQDTLLEALNAALESSTTDSTDDMIALEQEITRQSDIILNKALKKIVHATLAHKPAEVQQACIRFTKELKDKATSFITQLRGQLGNRSTFETSIGEFAATMRGLLNEAQNDPLLEGSAASIEQLITPIANIMTGLRGDLPEPQIRAILNELELGISHVPEIIHVDTQIVEGVMKKIESITSKVAYQGGKEFFNEAWKLLTKKPVWRFAAHRAMLSFIRK
jgi:hypothetical protein